MARRSWDQLSSDYRDRLEKAGITPQMHAAGESIRAARGHARTPEHPSEGVREPEKFRDWFDERQKLVRQVQRRKARMFKGSKKFNAQRSLKMVTEGSNNNPPSMKVLKWAATADDDELWEAMTSGDEDYSFLFYH